MAELAGLFALGVIYGATLCTITCLPYLGPYILSTGEGFKDGLYSSITFLTGKLITYTIMGGLASFLGAQLLSENETTAKYITGVIMVAVGAAMIVSYKKRSGCKEKHRATKRAPLVLLGISTSMLPCPAVIVMITLAAQSESLLFGSIYGLVYGLGVALSPLLIIGGGVAMIGAKVKTEALGFMPYLKVLSGLLIALMGIRLLGLEVG